MSSMEYNFAGIDSGAGSIMAAVNNTERLLDDGKAQVAKLAEIWGGSGSSAYQDVQKRWDAASKELNDSLEALSQRIGEAGATMKETDAKAAGMFGG